MMVLFTQPGRELLALQRRTHPSLHGEGPITVIAAETAWKTTVLDAFYPHFTEKRG